MQSERCARQRANCGGCEAQEKCAVACHRSLWCSSRSAQAGSPETCALVMVHRFAGGEVIRRCCAARHDAAAADALIFSAAASGAAWTRDSGARHADASTLSRERIEVTNALAPCGWVEPSYRVASATAPMDPVPTTRR